MYLPDKDKKIIVEFLKQKLKPIIIYLFGSFAKGEGRNDSDIDLAIYTLDEVNPYNLFVIGNYLSFEVKKDVQIIDLKNISTVFAAQIVGHKEILYCEDEVLMANYDIRALKDYVKLNEERQIVLEKINEDGKIYG